MSDDPTTLLVCARIRPGSERVFAQWQVRWQTAALASSGALSVEFWPPAPPDQLEAVAITRFTSVDTLRQWRRGEQNRALIDDVAPLVEGGLVMQLVGQAAVDYAVKHGVTMVMVTDIKPGKRGRVSCLGRSHPKAPGDVSRICRIVRPAAATQRNRLDDRFAL